MTNLVEKARALGAKQAVVTTPRHLYFDIRTRLKCRECRNYGNKMCPPNTFSFREWRQIIKRYQICILVTYSEDYLPETFQDAREKSGQRLQEILIELEKVAFNEGYYWASSLIGGSCRGCKSPECKHGPCTNPVYGRTSIEGAGIDVVKTCHSHGIDMQRFPHPKKEGGYITRVGMLMLK